ncbi:bile acid:sodium symporter family protein [Candidatus Latescibacterota bacterium]
MTDNAPFSNKRYKYLLAYGILAFITTVIYFLVGGGQHAGIPFVSMFVAMALYSKGSARLKGTAFTFWVFAFLAAAMYFPWLFTYWGFNTNIIVIPMLQLIMFGMGTKLSIADFMKEFRRPKGILIGTFMVFTIMPLLGVMVANLFRFPPEIAVGVILIGACPGGAASNVMAFLAKGNVALSVSVTTLATLITPIVTPALMKLFAGALLEVSFFKMMMSSFNLIIVPISAGLICNKILYGKSNWLKKPAPVVGIGVLAFALTAATIPAVFPVSIAVLKPGIILGFSLTGIVSITKVIVAAIHGPDDWMNKILPQVSMLSILLFVTIVVALNRDKLIVVGLMLVAASALHNLLGYIIGYWGSRAIGLSKRDSRTLSIEVALKNGGLGMGLAIEALGSQNAALAPIVFGKWMNISGSALANYWRQKPTGDDNVNNT